MNERDIFLSALEIEDPAARQAHVRSACAGDAQLMASVEALLTSHGQSQFLNTPIVEQMSDAESAVTMLVGQGSTADEEYPQTEFLSHGAGTMNENDDENPLSYLLRFLQPASRPDSKGRLAHYEILEVLGRGAFGTVLKAFDSKLERVVAIKLLAPEMAATSPARKRFLREARASAQIRHENVVSIHAVEEQPLPYLVMEYIPGRTLQDRLDDKGPLEVSDVLRLGRQIAEGLSAAHSHNLIHRDIKPGNILLEAGVHERVKITDFGLARAADDASLTQSSVIAGTPMYMAPEQALGKKLDQRADLFSLGSVIYQMVSGRPPFRAASTLAVLKRVTEDTPRPMNEVIPETPQWLCDIVTKLHAKSPDERYQTAQEVADVLADCEIQLKEHSRLKDLSRIPHPKTQPSGRWKPVAALVLVASMLAIGLYGFLSIKPADHPNPKIDELNAAKSSTSEPIQPEPINAVTAATSNQGTEQSIPANSPPLAIAPFDTAQAKAHQEAWAKHLGVPVEFTNSIDMTFRLIPPGEFTMGTSDPELTDTLNSVPDWAKEDIQSESPARKVRIFEPFYLGTTEVTVGQFKKFVAATGFKTEAETNGTGGVAWTGTTNDKRPEHTWRHPVLSKSDFNPVGQLCAMDAEAFCRWLRNLEGRDYRLPDEEQWEYACRAGTVTAWSCGTGLDVLDLHGLTGWDLSFTGRPVAQKPANPFGLFDVHGNLGELCRVKGYDYAERGGHGGGSERLVRSASRDVQDWYDSYSMHGFRVSIIGDSKSSRVPVAVPSQEMKDVTTPLLAVAPFNAVQAKAHQDAWAKHLDVPVEFTNEIGMKFRLIPPGEFTMGTSPEDAAEYNKSVADWAKDWVLSETPARRVQIKEPYYLGTTEVTVGQFKKFVAATGYKTHAEANGQGGERYFEGMGIVTSPELTWQHTDLTKSNAHPVGQVCPEDAKAFCRWLRKLDERTYQLPDEEQWECACRAGTVTPWSFGASEELAKLHGFTEWNLQFAGRAVAQSPANPFGLFDLHGNLTEMCRCQQETYINRGGDSGVVPLMARSATRGAPIDRFRSYFQQTFRVAVVGDLTRSRVPSGSTSP